MRVVSMSALEARMFEYVLQVEQTGEELVVTDNDRPVLRVVPIRPRRTAADLYADVRGKKVVYHEDILTPTEGEWPEP